MRAQDFVANNKRSGHGTSPGGEEGSSLGPSSSSKPIAGISRVRRSSTTQDATLAA